MTVLTYKINEKTFEEKFDNFDEAFTRYLKVTEYKECNNASCSES